jgi:hypothetical protein
VGREHQRLAGRHFAQFLDEDRALGAQVGHHVGVVDDFVAHVDRRAKLLGALDDFDGAVDAGAETARLGQQEFFIAHYSTEISCTSNFNGWPASGWLKSNKQVSSPSSRRMPAKRPPPGAAKSTRSPIL